jgi:GAF domain-containing protein
MTAEGFAAAPSRDAACGLLQAALDQVVDVVWTRIACERVSIMLADGDGDCAVLGLAAWRGNLAEDALHARVSSGASIAGRVYASACLQRVDDVDMAAPGIMARGEGGCFLCAPLLLDGRVLGVINIRRPRGDAPFSIADEQMLGVLALYAGKSIQAAQLAYLQDSGFAQRALESDTATPLPLMNAFAHGSAQPVQMARLLAKSFFREMRAAGFGPNQIVAAAGEIIDQLSTSLRKHGRRIERGQP